MRRFARILTMSAGLFLLPAAVALSAPGADRAAQAEDEVTCALPAGELAGAGELADASDLSAAGDPPDEAEPAASCSIVFFCSPDHFIMCGNKTICPCECE